MELYTKGSGPHRSPDEAAHMSCAHSSAFIPMGWINKLFMEALLPSLLRREGLLLCCIFLESLPRQTYGFEAEHMGRDVCSSKDPVGMLDTGYISP